MDLRPYIDEIHDQLEVAADAGGEDARALAERLVAPLDAAVRLSLLDALAAAAQEITCELAPGSVEVRLRGRDPEFVVTAPTEPAGDDLADGAATTTVDVSPRPAASSATRVAWHGSTCACPITSSPGSIAPPRARDFRSMPGSFERPPPPWNTRTPRDGPAGAARRAQRFTGWAR